MGAVVKPRKRGSKAPARTRQLPLASAATNASPAAVPPGPHSSLQFTTPAVADKLLHLGIVRLSDLVLHLPLRYEDETRITPIHEALSGDTVQIEGTVVKTEVKFRPG
ncbi:MAG TPA: ATP-dependent DNA helicase RecG, partial [Burkholderiales bacterium]|nr:ATP-dependent DNA helicase RecG [Burkholderiales bacterium]